MKNSIQIIAYRRASVTGNIYHPKPYQLDTTEATNVSINYNFEDIKNPETRKTDFSQSFKLPFTNNNNTFFENWYHVNISTLNYRQNEEVEAQILINGATVLTGNLKLLGVYTKGGYYDITILGKIASLFSSIGNKKVRKAFQVPDTTDPNVFNPDTELLHTWANTVIEQSWNGTLQNQAGTTINDTVGGVSKILYPLIGSRPNPLNFDSNDSENWLNATAVPNGGDLSTRNMLVYLSPALQLRTVLDLIFKRAGFTWSSTFLDSVYFRRIFMTLMDYDTTNLNIPVDNLLALYSGDAFQIAPTTATVTSTPYLTPNFSPTTFSDVGQTSLSASSFTGNALTTGTLVLYGNNMHYTPPETGTYQITFSTYFDHNAISGNSNVDILFSVRNFDSLVSFTPAAQTTIDLTGQTSEFLTLTTTVGMIGGQKYSPVMDIEVNSGYALPVLQFGQTTKINTDQYYNLQVLPAQTGVTFTGSTVNPSVGIDPELRQADLLRDIIQRFNLVIVTDKNDPINLIIEPAKDYLGTGESLHWENKIDENKEAIIKPTNDLQQAEIKFSDKKSSDFLNKLVSEEMPEYDIWGNYSEENYNIFAAKGSLTNKPVFAPFIVNRVPRATGSNDYDDLTHNLIVNTQATYDDTGELKESKQPHKLFYYNGTPTNLDTTLNFIDITVSGGVGTLTVIQYTSYPLCTAYELSSTGLTVSPAIDTRSLFWSYPSNGWINNSSLWNGVTADIRNTLYEYYWKRYIKEIYSDDSRLLELYLFLSPTDIINFSFKNLIYLKQAYWRVLKIENYQVNDNSSVKVTLLKSPDLNGTSCLSDSCNDTEYVIETAGNIFASDNMFYWDDGAGGFTAETSEACCDCVNGQYLNYTGGTGSGFCFQPTAIDTGPNYDNDNTNTNNNDNGFTPAPVPQPDFFSGTGNGNKSLHTDHFLDSVSKKSATSSLLYGELKYIIGGVTTIVANNPTLRNVINTQKTTYQLNCVSYKNEAELSLGINKSIIHFNNETINDIKIRITGIVTEGSIDIGKTICVEINTAFKIQGLTIEQIGVAGGSSSSIYKNWSTLTLVPNVTYALVVGEKRPRLLNKLTIGNSSTKTRILWTGQMDITTTSIRSHLGDLRPNRAIYQNAEDIAFEDGALMIWN